MPALIKDIWKSRRFYGYLAPTFLLLFVFCYYPPLSAMYHAFFDWNGANKLKYIGMDNFKELFLSDQYFRISMANVSKLILFAMVVIISVNILAAELIFHLKKKRGQDFYRFLFVIPMVVPGIVSLLLWQFMLDPNYGLVNAILRGIGLPQLQQAWLGDPSTALLSFMIIGFPWIGGVTVLILLAGLQNITTSIMDTAAIDGATGFRRIWHIDLPLIMGQIKLLVVMTIIGGLQGFGSQLILTYGGPGVSTLTPGLHMYMNAFNFDRMGYACAIGFVLFLLILSLTYLNMHFMKSSVEYEGQ